jgi:predicted alpha/beta-fold hydrolase
MVNDSDFLPKTKEREKTVRIEAGQFFDAETLRQVLELDEKSFPPGSAYEDAEDYYREQLANENNISIVARKEGGIVVGFMLITPQTKMVEEIGEDDPEFLPDVECAYVETMEISDEFRQSLRGGKIFVDMVNKGVEELVKKGYKRFSMHARKSMGLNEAVKRYFKGRIIKTREIAKWKWVADEPYEYIEGNLKEEQS